MNRIIFWFKNVCGKVCFLKISRVSTLDTITSFVTVSLFAVSLHLARIEHMHSKKHKMKFSKKASFIRDCYNSYYFLFQLWSFIRQDCQNLSLVFQMPTVRVIICWRSKIFRGSAYFRVYPKHLIFWVVWSPTKKKTLERLETEIPQCNCRSCLRSVSFHLILNSAR